MRRLTLVILFVLLAIPVKAVDLITATVTITNAPTTNNMTFVVNGNTRTWTSTVAIASSQIATNATVTGAKTNLYNQVSLNPFAQVAISDTGTNSFTLRGASGLAMAVSGVGAYFTVSYSTQLVTSMVAVRVPMSGEATEAARTNIAGLTAKGMNDLSPYSFSDTATLVANLVGKSNAQTVSGAKQFTSSSSEWRGGISNAPYMSGNVNRMTNGVYLGPALSDPALTNGINYGNAFSSPGSGILGSEQFGNGAIASGVTATALGKSSTASGQASTAVGDSASAIEINATAIGKSAAANNLSTVAIGRSAIANGIGATALGALSFADSNSAVALGNGAQAISNSATAIGSLTQATNTGSTALGYGARTTRDNQVAIGTSTDEVLASGYLKSAGGLVVSAAATNLSFSGQATFGTHADIAFARYSIATLANGNNAAVAVVTNVFIEVSGPSGAFTINGVANGRDGKMLVIINQTGQDMTVAHQSGTDPAAANRIISLTGADQTTTGNGAVTLWYSGAASRWIITSFAP